MIKKGLYIIFLFIPLFFVSQSTEEDEFEKFLEEVDELIISDEPEEENEESSYEYQTEQDKYLEESIEKKRFDREKWEKLRRDVLEEQYIDDIEEDYKIEDNDNPYRGDKKRRKTRFYPRGGKNQDKAKIKPEDIDERRRNRSNNQMPEFFSIPSWLGNFIIILLIIALAALIFYLFFKAPANEEDKKIKHDLDDIPPSEIPKSELQIRLEKALLNKDYRLAIRIYFIFLIKELSEKKLINWEKEKTNFSYLVEMRNHKYYNEFDETVMLYELIWYGKRKINEDDYRKIEPQFKSLVEKIEKV